MSDEERAGKLRDIDYKVGTFGLEDHSNKMHKDLSVMRIEGLLRKLKVPEKDVAETAEMVIRSAENGRHGPEEKQKEIVKIFVAPLLRAHGPELVEKAVDAIHQTAQMHVKEKFQYELEAKPATPQHSAFQPAKPRTPGR
jgi:hypothetical protein